MNNQHIRQVKRRKRRTLSLTRQKLAAVKIFHRISTMMCFQHAKRAGFYIANDGEISPEEILKHAIKRNMTCYASALKNKRTMVFRQYIGKSALEKHPYGFLQPREGCSEIAALELDIVFVPLVAFTHKGDRLGMGGGFYDRTFAFKKRSPWKAPILIGIAHQCQEVEKLATESWDVPMDYICTDRGIFKAKLG